MTGKINEIAARSLTDNIIHFCGSFDFKICNICRLILNSKTWLNIMAGCIRKIIVQPMVDLMCFILSIAIFSVHNIYKYIYIYIYIHISMQCQCVHYLCVSKGLQQGWSKTKALPYVPFPTCINQTKASNHCFAHFFLLSLHSLKCKNEAMHLWINLISFAGSSSIRLHLVQAIRAKFLPKSRNITFWDSEVKILFHSWILA